ncbi:MAG TPA: amino acid racemase [Pyrinomonadaceae bacterium]|nr:amino acid racemase [Pyrinomonadaceae bacterium]
MKTLGLIGGVGPESTIEYYRFIIDAYRGQRDGEYPLIVINSINLKLMLRLIDDDREQFIQELVNAVEVVARAGADFAAFAANTPHIVFDEVQFRSPIPLISIAEATREKAHQLGFEKVGLFGTGFTMGAKFYPEVFARAGLQLIVPNEEEREYIHDKYLGELLNNKFLPDTRDRMLAIAANLKTRDGIEALILGGTELPLLLRGEDPGIPLLDTTKIHVEKLTAALLE